MDVRPEDDTGGLIKNESGDHLEPHEEAAGLAAIAESAGCVKASGGFEIINSSSTCVTSPPVGF